MIQGPLMTDEGTCVVNKLMALAMERQRVVANNIANVNTPGYTRMDIKFTERLAQALESGDLADVANVTGELIEDTKAPARLDGNNVVLSREMNELMQNGILYNLLTKAFNTRISILKSAIS